MTTRKRVVRAFIAGVARLLDFGGALNGPRPKPRDYRADARALRADWYAIGDDMRAAMGQVARELLDDP